jgi:hypothetical protein
MERHAHTVYVYASYDSLNQLPILP